MSKFRKIIVISPVFLLATSFLSGCNSGNSKKRCLRVFNTEDYIYEYEEGDEEYASGEYDYQMDMINQFEHYWKDKTGEEIEVIYDTFDTNETMFNELKTGKTTYDVCIPSDYMIQKLYSENMLHKFSDSSIEEIWGSVSPFISEKFENIFATNKETGITDTIYNYSVPYMWGTMGIMYNPDYFYNNKGIDKEEIHEIMNDWDSLYGDALQGSFSIKDSVRDSFAVSLIHTYGEEVKNVENNEELTEIFNRHDDETFKKVKEDLNNLKENAFGFETDSGKTDMTTQKIGANMCWSGDATWAITEARDNDLELYYTIPTSYKGEENKGASNLWFDCFCMPYNGEGEEAEKQYELGEEFIKFMCTPEIAAQNCYCVGYTSSVAGDAMLDYIYDCYDVRGEVGATEIENDDGSITLVEDLVEGEDYIKYDLRYFYADSLDEFSDEDAILYADPDYVGRELTAQYPEESILDRLAIMNDFGTEGTAKLLDMWESVRTNKLPVWAIILFIFEIVCGLGLAAFFVSKKVIRKKIKKARI